MRQRKTAERSCQQENEGYRNSRFSQSRQAVERYFDSLSNQSRQAVGNVSPACHDSADRLAETAQQPVSQALLGC